MSMLLPASRPCLIGIIMLSVSKAVRALSTATGSSFDKLVQNQNLLSKATAASSGAFPVFNPAAPKDPPLAHVPNWSLDQVKTAIDVAQESVSSWRDDTTALQRSTILRRWSSLITENAADLATIMTLESGKPIAESKGEVAYATSFLDFFAHEVLRTNGYTIPTPYLTAEGSPKGQLTAISQGIGVCALISPWNFPSAMITRKVAPALVTGCPCLVKPSELTPFSALALQELAYEAGVPESVLQTITVDTEQTPAVGLEFCTNPMIRKLSFTGSTDVGKILLRDAGSTVKRVSMELGGNAPFLVLDDADVDVAVRAAMASKFRNAGQTCVCADRFLVHTSVHDEFVEKFVQAAQRLSVGPGIDPGNSMGPLITKTAADRVHNQIQDALLAGARLELGGEAPNEQFHSPTILTNVPVETDLWSTETFGPVAAIRTFDGLEEAMTLANASTTGLAGYVCTSRNAASLHRDIILPLECGLIGINEGIVSNCFAPFGGVKESGLGREGSIEGLAEYCETKYVLVC